MSLSRQSPSNMSGSPEGDPVKDDNAPWVFVTSKKKGRCGRRKALNPFTFHASPEVTPSYSTAVNCNALSEHSRNGPTMGTASHIQADYARVAAWWREQPSYQHLKTLISDQAPAHASVTRALCLGAGSYGGPLDGGEAFRRAHLQTAAFLLIVDLLGHGGSPIPCYFQEPMYTDADKDYIQGLGHTVIEAPVASRMITDTSLVFAIHLPLRDYLECLSVALPAMLIGTGYHICEGLPQFSVDSSSSIALQSLRAVHDTFDAYRFPKEKQDYCFSDTLIYWRPLKIE